jgi:hypothetical protein
VMRRAGEVMYGLTDCSRLRPNQANGKRKVATSPVFDTYRGIAAKGEFVHSSLKLTTTSMSDTTGSDPHIAGLNLQLFRVCRVASSIDRAALPTS